MHAKGVGLCALICEAEEQVHLQILFISYTCHQQIASGWHLPGLGRVELLSIRIWTWGIQHNHIWNHVHEMHCTEIELLWKISKSTLTCSSTDTLTKPFLNIQLLSTWICSCHAPSSFLLSSFLTVCHWRSLNWGAINLCLSERKKQCFQMCKIKN